MVCRKCNDVTSGAIKAVYYYRIGNDKIGWGNIGILACHDHAKLTINSLNLFFNNLEKGDKNKE